MSKAKTRSSWYLMRSRCRDKHKKDYKNYGGRGITICERWQIFDNFLTDMGERPAGLTLDRIDNDKGYYKENCQGADRKTQANNRRQNQRKGEGVPWSKLTNEQVLQIKDLLSKNITHHTRAQLAKQFGVSYSTI